MTTTPQPIATQFASLHSIDRNLDSSIKRDVNTGDAISYVQELINETRNNPNKRAYKFQNSTSPILQYTLEVFNQRNNEDIENIFSANSIKFAERLLLAEQNSVAKYPSINHPKKGSLIITVENHGINLIITMAKIETADFLEDIQLELKTGLPKNKKALKTAVINITQIDDSEIDIEITATDSGTNIAKYWTIDFLEAEEITSDEKNTTTAFNSIEKILSRNLKEQAPSDYTELRNNLVGYFKTQPAFHFEQMIEHVFGSYEMENSKVNIDDIKSKVNNLISNAKFDTQFSIKPQEIKARFKRTYKVSEEIELRTNGHIDGLKHVIKATENSEGIKVLEIKIDNEKIYQQFKFKDEH